MLSNAITDTNFVIVLLASAQSLNLIKSIDHYCFEIKWLKVKRYRPWCFQEVSFDSINYSRSCVDYDMNSILHYYFKLK